MTDQLNELAYYAVTHHPADARKVFPEATDAEALGLGSCMISERFTVKEMGALAGAVAGRAPSLGIASAAINHHTRHPEITAAMGSTLKAITEGKYAMAFGRGSSEHWKTLGLPVVTEAMLRDFIGLLRQLWTDGFVLDHDGPSGKWPVLHNLHGLEGGGPPLGLVAVGPKTMELAGLRLRVAHPGAAHPGRTALQGRRPRLHACVHRARRCRDRQDPDSVSDDERADNVLLERPTRSRRAGRRAASAGAHPRSTTSRRTSSRLRPDDQLEETSLIL